MTLHHTVPADGLREIDQYAARHGLDLSLHLGFDGFAEYPLDRGGHPVFAGFTPPRDGFWIAVTLDGEPFATYAAMALELATTLTDLLETVGLYRGEEWRVVTEEGRAVTNAVTDLAMFNGGIVVDASGRGTEASRAVVELLPIAGRAIGHGLYDAEHFFYFVKEGRRLGKRFAPEVLCERAIRWTRDGHDLGLRDLGYVSWGFARKRLEALSATMR